MHIDSNFSYISSDFNQAYQAAKEAEENVFIKPITSAMYSRQAMEFLVNWVYQHDQDYEIPYQNTLVAKIRGDAFQKDVSPSIIRELDYIRKTGNNAVHRGRVNQNEALACIKFLFHWTQYVTKVDTNLEHPQQFEESFIPKKTQQKENLRQIAYLRDQLQEKVEQQKSFEKQINENDELKSKLEALQIEIAKLKDQNKHVPIPEPDISEAETRKLYIDADLKAAGWNIEDQNVQEYEISNMPKSVNITGKGYIDYVLWGDDGLPLAVIEAKKSSRSIKDGKHQANLYADCLEKSTGQRPILFYTNGFKTYIWDDAFSIPRLIYGMYTKSELEQLVKRRTIRQDLRTFRIDKDIANRYYQEEAFKRVAETLCIDDDQNGFCLGKSKALLVMATGTGKTRTAIAIVKMMMKANWAKKVLFLADRNPLVKQAKKNFTSLTPEFTSINLTQEPDDENVQLVFSTYQTMINRIDDGKQKDGIAYGVGHFDLIIVDEAHRSIYSKYKDIFHYFDALIVGLTATPRGDADHDTYDFFQCEYQIPTYFYELDQAVKDKWLVPFKQYPSGTKFLSRGIKYDELSEEDKIKFEDAFVKYGDEILKEISSADINKWLFNKDTVNKIISHLMEHGLKVESGDVIGKTIIFAANQAHADYIEKQFNLQYPQYKGHWTSVITYKDKYAQTQIENFEKPNKNPRIAISVDMLDTGIDVPSVLNLVFFKPVYSKTKFWQMIGRGTRLCEDLFGPDQDKKEFIIFDCCMNFEYFDMNPEGRIGTGQKSVSHAIFEMRILLAEALRAQEFQNDSRLMDLRQSFLTASHQILLAFSNQRETNFSVRLRLGVVEKFAYDDIWKDLNPDLVKEVSDEVGPIVIIEDEDEKAKLFDLLMYRMELAYIQNHPVFEKGKKNVIERSKQLQKKSNINAVREKLPLITMIQQESYWKEVDIPKLEFIRIQLRHLMSLLQGKKQELVETDLEDVSIFQEPQEVSLPKTPKNYLDKVKSYIRNNRNLVVIQKLINNQPITKEELDQLESILFDGDERGTRDDFTDVINGDFTLGHFIRSIFGLDRRASLEAFSEFLSGNNISADQQKFIETLIDHFENKGYIDPSQLFESPYKELHLEGVEGVFGDQSENIISIVDGINHMAIGN